MFNGMMDEFEFEAAQGWTEYRRHCEELKGFTLEAMGYPGKRPCWRWDANGFTPTHPNEGQPNGIHLRDIVDVERIRRQHGVPILIDELLAEYGLWLTNVDNRTTGAKFREYGPLDLYDIHNNFVRKL